MAGSNTISEEEELKLNKGLYHAAGDGILESVKELLLQGAIPTWNNPQCWDGEIALHSAAEGGHVNVVETLLKYGADVKSTNKSGWTALHHAAMGGHVNVVETLLKYGADVKITDKWGDTALHNAALAGHVTVVETLLKYGADVKSTNKVECTALHSAARGGHVNVVETLLKYGADVKITDKWRCTALHCAARCGHVNVVETLLKYGADVKITDKYQKTALKLVIQLGHTGVVQTLVKYETDTNITDKSDKTFLYMEKSGRAAKLLIEGGASVTIVDKNGRTPLHNPWNSRPKAELLIKNGASVNAVDKYQLTPLHVTSDVKVANVLINNGADIKAIDKNGNTCIHSQAILRHKKVLSLLLSKVHVHQVIDAKNNDGVTPVDILRSYDIKQYEFVKSYGFKSIAKKRKECLQMLMTEYNIDLTENLTQDERMSPSENENTTPIDDHTAVKPNLFDVYHLLRSHSHHWDDIGRKLGVKHGFRKGLKSSKANNSSKLEQVLHNWLNSHCSEPSWDNLINALEMIELTTLTEKLKQYLLNDEDAIRKYNWKDSSLSSTIDQPSNISENRKRKNDISQSESYLLEAKRPRLETVKPHLNDVYDLLRSHSHQWNDIGRELGIDYSHRTSLDGSTDDDPSKLEEVLDKWLESHCSVPSWDNLIDVLKVIGLTECAKEVEQYLLMNEDAIKKYDWKENVSIDNEGQRNES